MKIVLGLLLATSMLAAQNATDTPDAHVAVAKAAAGDEYQNLFNFVCAAPANRGGAGAGGQREQGGGGQGAGAAARGQGGGRGRGGQQRRTGPRGMPNQPRFSTISIGLARPSIQCGR
jgi:hypothetical protein